MANILYYPQMSMYDKQTKQLLPEADGNINMMRNTINEWKKHRPQDMFFILLPSELKNKMSSIFNNWAMEVVPLFYNNYVVSARINRFNFPMNEFSSLLRDIPISLIINDVIELTSNFKQMFIFEFGYNPKVISNIRHIDDVINHQYMHRVIDGIIQSDLITILSETMKEELEEQITILTGLNKITNNLITFEPSISYDEIKQYYYNAKVFDNNKIRITFPGRLAKGEERRTNWDRFQEAIINLRNKRKDFEVYFTDPNSALDPGFAAIDWVKVIPKDRRLFLNLLNNTDVIVSLMDVEGFGGISIREALLFDCLPIIPYAHEYKKMAPDFYPGFVDSPIKVDDLVNALEYGIIKAKTIRKLKHNPNNLKEIGMQFTVEEQFKKLLPYLEEL